jgi:ribonuclease P protein component
MPDAEPVGETAAAIFGAGLRLRRPEEFSSVLALRKFVTGKSATLYFAANGLKTARLGLIVSRRTDKLAVGRNLFKRIAREAFRTMRLRLPPMDLILRATAPPRSRGKAQLRLDIDRLLSRLC